jgi:5-methylcytosine-specific restriction enzyme A
MPWGNTPEDRRRSNTTYGARWRRARTECLNRARWKCQLRLDGICTGAATQVDHIQGVAEGGSLYDQANLRAACEPCHKARTAQQGGGYRRPGSRKAADPEPKPWAGW